MNTLLDRWFHKRTLQRWRSVAGSLEVSDPADLRVYRDRARALLTYIDRTIHFADGQLALPRIGSSSFPKPHGTDWSWRPSLWRGPLAARGLASPDRKVRLDEDVVLFHDCDTSEITLRQLRNTRVADLAPFGLKLDVFKFNGSFLSLAITLPPEARQGITRSHLFRLDTIVEKEQPVGMIARLNVQHGPNTEQIVRQLPHDATEASAEFDLAYTKMNDKRIEKIWLDLILEQPAMNQVVLRDLTLCRHHRADL
ncbi:DUF6478 family protein [Ruegeria sp. HKCCD8929]|uniref:DUF6478 family protein n=1 Tax=Ruegeria sp. HKCCD8929 TaxID=2683006 RepID=UPI001487C53D|nr:DUF6478 family protein [Ruegeria sp. HKCCD8929]